MGWCIFLKALTKSPRPFHLTKKPLIWSPNCKNVFWSLLGPNYFYPKLTWPTHLLSFASLFLAIWFIWLLIKCRKQLLFDRSDIWLCRWVCGGSERVWWEGGNWFLLNSPEERERGKHCVREERRYNIFQPLSPKAICIQMLICFFGTTLVHKRMFLRKWTGIIVCHIY